MEPTVEAVEAVGARFPTGLLTLQDGPKRPERSKKGTVYATVPFRAERSAECCFMKLSDTPVGVD